MWLPYPPYRETGTSAKAETRGGLCIYQYFSRHMATKKELENSAFFRATKVFYGLIVAIILGVTLFFWYTAGGDILIDANNAYFICNGGTVQHPLIDEEKDYLQIFHKTTLEKGEQQSRINMICHSEYAGSNPATASEADVARFRESTMGSDGRVYTLGGIQEKRDLHLNGLIMTLLIEAAILFTIMAGGLYIAGGREALKIQ